jgi:hypothetical protein
MEARIGDSEDLSVLAMLQHLIEQGASTDRNFELLFRVTDEGRIQGATLADAVQELRLNQEVLFARTALEESESSLEKPQTYISIPVGKVLKPILKAAAASAAVLKKDSLEEQQEEVQLGHFTEERPSKKKSSDSKRREGSNSHKKTPRQKDSDNPSSSSDDSSDPSRSSSMDEDDQSNPDSEASNDGDPERRRSIFYDAKQSAKTSKKNAKIMIIKTPPPYDHILLKTLEINEVIEFFEAIKMYETKHHISLPTSTLTSKGVRETLIARSSSMTPVEFFKLDSLELIRLIQRYLRPRDVIEFSSKLKKNVSFKFRDDGVKPLEDFGKFYEAMLVFNLRFRSVYDFLRRNNASHCPPCNNKEGGLLRDYLDMIPDQYGKNVFKSLRAKEYNSYSDFEVAFMKKVKKHHKDYRRFSSVRNFMASTGNSSSKPFEKKEDVKSAPIHSGATPRRAFRPFHKVHLVDGEETDTRVDVSIPEEFYDPDDLGLEQSETFEIPAPSTAVASMSATEYEKELSSLLPQVNVIAPPRPPYAPKSILKPPYSASSRGPVANASSTKACISKLLYGDFNKPNCTYAHDNVARSHRVYWNDVS